MEVIAADVGTIRTLEELGFNSWPALQTIHYDGWLIRLAGGYTRRSNSVSALYPSSLPIPEKLAYCEQVFREAGVTPTFKLTDAAEPRNLDSALAEAGYKVDRTISLVMAHEDLSRVGKPDSVDMEALETPTEAWLREYIAMRDEKPAHLPLMPVILNAIYGAKVFVTLRKDGEPVAMGMASIERGYTCFHNIVTAHSVRGQGFGKNLMRVLCNWAVSHGGHKGYLQVDCANAPAMRLYAVTGFRPAYTYWYRAKA